MKWTLKKCKADALKYISIYDWKKKSKKAYQTACKYKWLEKCCKHMEKYTKFLTNERVKKSVKNKCKKDALKYTRRIDWVKHSVSLYQTASINGWLDECCKHMDNHVEPVVKKQFKELTFDECKADSLKYTRKFDWRRNSYDAYQTANKNGWLGIFCKHMKKYNVLV